MRNLDDNNLDELFRNDLEPDYDKFDEANWEEMESKLNGIAPKAKKLPLMGVAQYAAVLLVLMVGSIVFWQMNESRVAIDTLSNEVLELKKAQEVETMQAIVAPVIEEETTTAEATVSKPKITEEKDKAKPVKGEKTIAKAVEKKESAQPAEAKVADDKKEQAKPVTSATPKYYMLVDGEFIPVSEFDHPGAEQGDSTHNKSIKDSQQASN